jgi:CHAT domain-containing protein
LLSRITQRAHFEASALNPTTEEATRLTALEDEINHWDDKILRLLNEGKIKEADKIFADRRQRQTAFSELKLAITLRQNKLGDLDGNKVVELQKLREEILAPDEVFLSYYVTVAHVYCLEISRSAQALHCLGAQKILNTTMDEYRQALGEALEGKNKNYVNTAHGLWRLLTKSGKLMPDTSTHYLISPDAQIGYIAFEGLPTDAEAKNPTYAGTQYQVIYQPSASLLDGKRCEPDFTFEVAFIGFANSSFNFHKFAELSGPEDEVREIAKHFYRRGESANINLNATKEAFLEQTAKTVLCLHLATHAASNFDGLPELKNLGLEEPALILNSPSGRPADFLLASEIFSKNIRAKLVTLSACDTGIGGLIRGEGIGSLARAFFGAGAGCVVFSMWPVRDDSARDFMVEFYKEMTTRPIDDALFTARRTMAKRYPDPVDWAPFIVAGNARTKLWNGERT